MLRHPISRLFTSLAGAKQILSSAGDHKCTSELQNDGAVCLARFELLICHLVPQKPPTDPHDIRREIARMKAERLAKLEANDSSSPDLENAHAASSGRLV